MPKNNDTIFYTTAFRPRPREEITLYRTPFPAPWMDRLYEILPEGIQNLPLYSLNKFLNLSMSNLHAKWSSRSQSDWLVSLVPLTDAMRQEILYTVKAWVRVDCTRRLKKSPCMERKKQELKEMADNLRTDDLITV